VYVDAFIGGDDDGWKFLIFFLPHRRCSKALTQAAAEKLKFFSLF
jgi:hypothetical protein